MKYEFGKIEEDPDAEVEDFEIDVVKGSKHVRKNWKIFGLAACGGILFVLFVLCVATSGLLAVFLTQHHIPDPPSYFSEDDVRDSIEFQIGLRPTEDWTDREGMFDLWIAAINENSKYLNVSKDTALVDIYTQFHLVTTGKTRCNSPDDFKMRIRSYFFGEHTTIDIKGGEAPETKEKSCNQPYWPAEQYYESSVQKCEEDVHPCFSKFTRGTTVTFPVSHIVVTSCELLANIFPDAFYNVDETNKNNPVDLANAAYWYKYQWKNDLGEHMHCEIQFTIEYLVSIDKILEGNYPIREGEWSLRFWVDKGFKWEMEIVEDLESLFYQLVLLFDHDYPDHFVCADEFLAGDRSVGIDLGQHEDVL